MKYQIMKTYRGNSTTCIQISFKYWNKQVTRNPSLQQVINIRLTNGVKSKDTSALEVSIKGS
jgi:hypothetical protein